MATDNAMTTGQLQLARQDLSKLVNMHFFQIYIYAMFFELAGKCRLKLNILF